MRCKEQGFVKRCAMGIAVIVMALSFQGTGLEAKTDKDLRFSIGLNGGYALWSLDDFGISQKSYENKAQEMGFGYIAEELKGSLFGGIDLSLEFHSLGLSTGFRHFPGGTFENGLTSDLGPSSTKLDLSTFVIPVELYYKLPVSQKFVLKLGAGVDYYKATVDYDLTNNSDGTGYYKRGRLKDSGIGGHITFGAQYFLNDKNVAITIESGYSLAKLDNFTGPLVDSDGHSSESLLIMAPDDFGEFLVDYPAAPGLPPGTRMARWTFNGFKVTVGFRYIFEAQVGKAVPVPCPDKFSIGATGCYPPGVTPTPWQGKKALEALYKRFNCKAPCRKVITYISSKNSGYECGNTGKIMWEFKGILECKK